MRLGHCECETDIRTERLIDGESRDCESQTERLRLRAFGTESLRLRDSEGDKLWD